MGILDIDMKRFIVTFYHYYHRPYCYYSLRESRFLVQSAEPPDCVVKIIVVVIYKYIYI